MKKRSTLFSIITIAIGLILMTVSLASCSFKFKDLDKSEYESNTYEISDPFNNISIVSNTADITFVKAEGENTSVVCFDHKKMPHTVSVKDGTLTISIDDERKWFDHIMPFSTSTPTITVYLPEGEYGALSVSSNTSDVAIPSGFTFESINVSLDTGDVSCSANVKDFIKAKARTGDVSFSDMSANNVEISLSTGDVTLKKCSFGSVKTKTSTGNQIASDLIIDNAFTIEVSSGDTDIKTVNCKSFTNIGSTGEISLENVTVTETLFIERSTGDVEIECCTAGYMSVKTSTGDVEFDRSDAGEIYAKTSTGDVEGSLLTSKIFITSTNTGKVRVPASTSGGICEITTTTGDIKITTP